jgi:hypothetical protein
MIATGSSTIRLQPERSYGSMLRRRMRGAARWSSAARGGRIVRSLAVAVLLTALCGSGTPAHSVPLSERIPGLYGGTLITTIQKSLSDPTLAESQRLRFAAQFQSLSAALAAAHSQAPIPSASGAFRFAWDPELDTFVRSTQSLGSGVAERAPTLGRYTGTFSVSYTHIDFDTLEGNALGRLSFSQSAFSQEFLNRLVPADQALFADDLIQSQLRMGLSFDTFYFTGAFGITDSIDVSLALSVSEARMHASVVSRIEKPGGQRGASFVLEQGNRLVAKSGTICGFPTPTVDAKCATDSFDDSAFGTGDLFLRGKWHFYDTEYADLAVAGVLTVPTGNADDFLGFHDPTFTPWLIASKNFGSVSPHLNLGYALRSGDDVSQAQWIAGADWRTTKWLTLAADFLGYHDDDRDGVNDDILQSAVGFKVNPFGKFVLGGTFQFPLNRDGLRADVIYGGQLEYTF